MTRTISRLTHLGDLPVEKFLREYWQKKPLFIKNAFANFSSPISPDELASFALDQTTTSRLIVENRTKRSWDVEHGPLEPTRFEQLPNKHWTLLVQYADSLDPALNALITAFRFIPQWRIDDIMVSFAADGGGVGPHFDFYDVFLLQAEGQKRWRLGQRCSVNSPLVEGLPMKILSDFTTTDEWVVEPGDLLYVPAQIAHWGESIGESLTYSIGFRAPSHSEILLDYSQDLAAATNEEQRYQDRDTVLQTHAGEISSTAYESIREILRSNYEDDEKLQRWLGEHSTQLGQDIDDYLNPISIDAQNPAQRYVLNHFCRCAFSTLASRTMVFINGLSWRCSRALAITLSEHASFSVDDFSGNDKGVIADLAHYGFLEAE